MSEATLEQITARCHEERVPSSAIQAVIDSILRTNKFTTSMLYTLIEKNISVQGQTLSKLRNLRVKTGSKAILEYLVGLQGRIKSKSLSPEEDSIGEIRKLANNVYIENGFRNHAQFFKFLVLELRKKRQQLNWKQIDYFLFSGINPKALRNWHLALHSILEQTRTKHITVSDDYIRRDFDTYQKLMKYSCTEYTTQHNTSVGEYVRVLSSRIGLAPKTIENYMSAHNLRKTKESRTTRYQRELLSFIKEEILNTVDLSNSSKLMRELSRYSHSSRSRLKKSKVLVILSPEYNSQMVQFIQSRINEVPRGENAQIEYVFNSVNLENTILKLITPYTASQSSHS